MSFATQTDYDIGARVGAPGNRADSGPWDAKTCAAAEAMYPGKALAYKVSDLDKESVRLPQLNQITVLGDADVTGAITATLVTTDLDGNATTTAINVAFDTDHDTTMGNLKTALDAITNVSSELTDLAGDNRTIVITSTNDVAMSLSVSFASTGVSYTETLASTDTIIGISGSDFAMEKDLDGNVYYRKGDEVPVALFGRRHIEPETALALSDTLYARFTASGSAGGERGSLTNTAGSPINALDLSSVRIALDRPVAAAGDSGVVDINTKGS